MDMVAEIQKIESAARMAMEAGVPILPVVIWGGQRIFTKNRKKDLRRGAHVRIVVGETFTPDPAGNAVEVTAELKKRIAGALTTDGTAGQATPKSSYSASTTTSSGSCSTVSPYVIGGTDTAITSAPWMA